MELPLKQRQHLLSGGKSDCIKHSLKIVPPALTDIAAINRQPVPLRPSVVQLPNPIHPQWIIICWLHLLFSVHLQSSCCGELLLAHFPMGESDLTKERLLDVIGEEWSNVIARRRKGRVLTKEGWCNVIDLMWRIIWPIRCRWIAVRWLVDKRNSWSLHNIYR